MKLARRILIPITVIVSLTMIGCSSRDNKKKLNSTNAKIARMTAVSEELYNVGVDLELKPQTEAYSASWSKILELDQIKAAVDKLELFIYLANDVLKAAEDKKIEFRKGEEPEIRAAIKNAKDYVALMKEAQFIKEKDIAIQAEINQQSLNPGKELEAKKSQLFEMKDSLFVELEKIGVQVSDTLSETVSEENLEKLRAEADAALLKSYEALSLVVETGKQIKDSEEVHSSLLGMSEAARNFAIEIQKEINEARKGSEGPQTFDKIKEVKPEGSTDEDRSEKPGKDLH